MTVARRGLALMTALLLGGQWRSRLDTQRRSRMERSLTAKAAR